MGAENCFWLADIHSSHTLVRSIFINRGLNADIPTTANSIKPVIEISYVTILEGDGVLTVPYIGNTSKATSVSDIAIGEYISIPKSDGGTYLARVVKHDQDGTKVILNGLYTESVFGSSPTFSTSSTVYTEALTEFKNSLDSTYFDSVNRSFNMTMYPFGGNYTSTTTMFNGNIGLPSVGEMFSGNDINIGPSKTFVDLTKIYGNTIVVYYWLINPYDLTDIISVNYAGYFSYSNVTQGYGVRPTWYVKNVNIV